MANERSADKGRCSARGGSFDQLQAGHLQVSGVVARTGAGLPRHGVETGLFSTNGDTGDARVEFKVLGPLEVTDGSRVIDITAPKQRAILTVLLIHANKVVSLDRLVDELWGEQPPPRGIAALQAYISNLRRALEPNRAPRAPARILVSRPPGYVLVVDPDRYDAARFAAAVANGAGLLDEGRPHDARQALEEGLRLWRGPALGEFAFEPFAQAEAARLEELRARALETRARADLALGRHGAAVADLEALVARYPLREGVWAAYLLALYRAGRQADALRAYQACRRALADELGIDPGPELRRLEDAILTQDPSLDWRPPTPVTQVPAPVPTAAPSDDSHPPLVGRVAELQRLREAWAAARAGRGRLVLLAGDAGIGKTRLAEELAAHVVVEGGEAVWGRAHEGGGAPAFWPWAELLRALVAAHPLEQAAAALASVGLTLADLAPFVPSAGASTTSEPPPLADPGAGRFRLNQAAAAVLAAFAAERPLLVVLDDLHWADVASLQLLQFLAPTVVTAPLLVVATYRHLEVDDDHPLADTLASLARQPALERLTLEGLDADEVARFVAVATGREASPAVATGMHRRTEGNPFFVGELVRLLDAEHRLEAAADVADVPVPVGVRDVIRRRLARLPEQTNALLAMAAVVGHEFDLAVLEAMAGLEGDAAIDALEPALLTGLLAESAEMLGYFRFSHALVRETLYEGLSGVRRARLHARVGEALERLGRVDDPEAAAELARHLWRAAQVVGPTKAVAALLRAAEGAIARLAFEQAEEQLMRAIELLRSLPPGEDRDRQELWAQVRLGMVRATTKGQGSAGAAASFARARELCGRVTHAAEQLPTYYGLFLASWIQLDLAAASTYADQLLEVGQREHDLTFLVAGHQAAGLVAFERGALARARHHFESAVATADSIADPWLADVLQGDPAMSNRCFAAFVAALTGSPDKAIALASEGLERARRSGHTWSEGVALVMRAWVATVLGHRRARVHADEAAAFVAERGFELLAAVTTSLRGWALAQDGQGEAGMALVEQGLAAAEATGMRLMRPLHLAMAAEAAQCAGRQEHALEIVERGLAEVEATDERFYEAELLRLRGELVAVLDPRRSVEADAVLRRAVAVAESQGARTLQRRAEASLESLRARHGAPAVESRS